MRYNSVLEYILKSSPEVAFKYVSLDQNINQYFQEMHEAFSRTKTIDVIPLGVRNNTGFMLVLDQTTALYFSLQNGRFVYDGFEVGQYLKGENNVFKLPPAKS